MYLAAAETTKAIVNAVKPKSNTDKTHLGQFEYAVWVNVVSDSGDMVKRHGIFPQPKINMNSVLPSLNVFHDHWTACSSDTKQDVRKLIFDTFSKKAKLLTTVGQRPLGKQKTFDTKRPLHAIQLLLQAYKVREQKKTQLYSKVENTQLVLKDHKRVSVTPSTSTKVQSSPSSKLLISQNSPLSPMMSFSTPKQLPPQSISAIQTATMTRKR